MMVSDQFPMFRLVTLLARQLSSPIALRIKQYAVNHPRIGGLLCRRVAHTYNECEWLARLWTLRLAGVPLPRNAQAPPLRDQAAVNLGGELLGEIIIFSLGSLIIIYEVNRQAANKENKARLIYFLKKLDKKSEWVAIMLSLEEIQHELNLQQADMNRLQAALLALQEQHLRPNQRITE